MLMRPGVAQSQQQADRCADQGQVVSPDQQIDACTTAIESGRWRGAGLAWAYNNRSFAYILRGDYDRAMRMPMRPSASIPTMRPPSTIGAMAIA